MAEQTSPLDPPLPEAWGFASAGSDVVATRAVEPREALSASAVADSPPRLGSDPNLWGGLLSANSDVVGLV